MSRQGTYKSNHMSLLKAFSGHLLVVTIAPQLASGRKQIPFFSKSVPKKMHTCPQSLKNYPIDSTISSVLNFCLLSIFL